MTIGTQWTALRILYQSSPRITRASRIFCVPSSVLLASGEASEVPAGADGSCTVRLDEEGGSAGDAGVELLAELGGVADGEALVLRVDDVAVVTEQAEQEGCLAGVLLDDVAKPGEPVVVHEVLGQAEMDFAGEELVGLGEGADHLAPFEPESFVDALLG